MHIARRITCGAIFALLSAFPVAGSQLYAFDCNRYEADYSAAVRNTDFTRALGILSDCSNSCSEDERYLCTRNSVILQKQIERYVEDQLLLARTSRESDPFRSIRQYQKVMETAKSNPVKYSDALEEVRRELPSLRQELDKRIYPLVAEGEQALEQYRFDTVRDVIFEIYSIEWGNAGAVQLSKNALEKLEEYMKEREKLTAKLLDALTITVEDAAREPSSGKKKKLAEMAHKKSIKLAADIEQSLGMNPGDERFVRLSERTNVLKASAAKKGVKVAIPDTPKTLLETPKTGYKLAVEMISKGRFSEAISKLNEVVKSKSFDRETVASAYIYRGIAFAAQMTEGNAQSQQNRKLRGDAKTSFKGALAFNPQVKIPPGYDKYAQILDETRNYG